MEEVDFRSSHGQLAVELSTHKVDGVHEGQLPLDLEACIELGCCVTVAPHAAGKAVGGDVFDLTDLEVRGCLFMVCLWCGCEQLVW